MEAWERSAKRIRVEACDYPSLEESKRLSKRRRGRLAGLDRKAHQIDRQSQRPSASTANHREIKMTAGGTTVITVNNAVRYTLSVLRRPSVDVQPEDGHVGGASYGFSTCVSGRFSSMSGAVPRWQRTITRIAKTITTATPWQPMAHHLSCAWNRSPSLVRSC